MYTDRKSEVIRLARQVYEFTLWTEDTVAKLYEIVVHEFENWDGEEVTPDSVLIYMVNRYHAFGLAPSRN